LSYARVLLAQPRHHSDRGSLSHVSESTVSIRAWPPKIQPGRHAQG